MTLFCRWWHQSLERPLTSSQSQCRPRVPGLPSSSMNYLCFSLPWKSVSPSPVLKEEKFSRPSFFPSSWSWSPTALPSISYFFPLSCSPASPPSLPPSPINAFGPPCFTNTLLICHFWFAINLPKRRLSQVGHLLLPHTLLASPLTCSMSKALLPSLTVSPGVPSAPSWMAPCPLPTLLFLSALNSQGDGDDFTFRTEQKPDRQLPGAREMAKAGLPGKFLWAGVLFSRMTTPDCHF